MFGKSPFSSANTSAFGSSSLFGSSTNRPTTGFGAQTTTQSTGLFGQKSIFGSPGQTTSLFGSSQPASTASTSIFGQSKPLFGSSATTQSTGFGGTTSLFGSTQPAQQTGSIFGSSFGTSNVSGTTIKFEPPTATDTMLRNGTNQTISTKHMCITAMKQYENKSLEELRCEDYLANRKGPQTGSLTFGQTSQPSTSLFGSSATTTQSSIFGQNKPLFGSTSTGFGAPTTTSSSLFGTPATNTSIFGSKPATGGLFGSSTTASPFGQTQTSTGLFGSKPATGFGAPTSSLFGGSTFNTTTTTASPFSFGGNTATTSAPFGQTQPAFSSFSGFQQPSASTASTSLFGAKPATSGFGAFGTSTSNASPFGTQQTGGLFGSKPTGGLFGSNTGSLFGQTAASSAPTFFGSTASKPSNTLFGSTTTQPAFGSAQQTTGGNAASAAPIVLGANVNQWLIENAMIEAQLATNPYGDNPLLKLLTTKEQEKSDMPNPVSAEQQMRFLASRKEAGAVTTTTPSGPLALGSIPAAGTRINSLSAKTRNNIGDFSYRSMFSPPALRSSSRRKSVNMDGSADRSRDMSNSFTSKEASSFLQFNNSQTSKSKATTNVKRLDLSVLHNSVENRRRSNASSMTSVQATQTDGANEAVDNAQEVISNSDTRSGTETSPSTRRTSVSFHLPAAGISSTETSTASEKRRTPQSGTASGTPQSILRRSTQVSSPSVLSQDMSQDSSLNLTNSTNNASSDNVATESAAQHPAGIILTRRDYECEPSLEELAEMALQNDGICHIESGFTVRRLAFGSVFWPGPFDLYDIDLDKVVHFRQHEVIVYPDDESKPPVGEELNRFAEVSLDRVWPRDKKTKEYITDPIRLEEMGYRAKLERASLKMGAKFKDYRPETGTWVFSVPHFTKYGLNDSDDEEMLDEAQLKIALNDSKIQDAVQRAKLPKGTGKRDDVSNVKVVSSAMEFDDLQDGMQDLKRFELRSDAVYFARGLGGNYGHDSSFTGLDSFLDSKEVADYVQPSIKSEREHKMEFCDNKVVLDDLMADSMVVDEEEKDESICELQNQIIDPTNKIEFFIKNGRQTVSKMASKTSTFIDGSQMNERSGRVGWGQGLVCFMSDIPNSLSVRSAQLHRLEQQPSVEYIVDLFQKTKSMSIIIADGHTENLFFEDVPERKPEGKFLDVINCLLEASKTNAATHDTNVWELFDALFGSQFTATSDYTKKLSRREDVAKWLQNFLKNREGMTTLPSSDTAKILHFLLNGDLERATETATDSSYPHLAFALSTFKYTDRKAYKDQIDYWKKTRECKFINEDLIKIYLLLAGEMKAEINGKMIFINDGLDGLRALGTFLWYFDPFDASLKDVLNAFENDLTARKANDTIKHDIFYELIRFACDPGQSMETVLEPNYPSLHPMDYHVSWHLWFASKILGFNVSKTVEFTLHTRYAEQLCRMGLYHLAAFVLMHISDLSSRNTALIELGDRIADKVNDEECTKLSTVAQLPDSIIARSKYMRAKLNNDEAKMCLYALQGGMLDEAHTIFFERVAPNAIISAEYDFLGELGEMFEKVSDRIPAWGPGGQIFIDFCLMKKKLETIRDDAEMKEIIHMAHSIELRLIAMSLNNPVQRLGASFMSKYVFKLIYGFEGTDAENLPLCFEDALEIASDIVQPCDSANIPTYSVLNNDIIIDQ